MIKKQAITTVKRRLANINVQGIDDTIVDEMDFVQEFVMEGFPENPWFLLNEEHTGLTLELDRRVSVPDDFLAEWEDGSLRYIPSDPDAEEVHLNKDDYDILAQQLPGTGAPRKYAFGANYFHIFPTPDKAYTLQIIIYTRQPKISTLNDNGTNLWLTWAADWLIAATAAIIAGTHTYDKQGREMHTLLAEQAISRIFAKDTAMRQANFEQVMGD